MLFADGHVEEWGDLNSSLASAGNIVLPLINPGGTPAGFNAVPPGPRQNFSPVNINSGGGGNFTPSKSPVTPATSIAQFSTSPTNSAISPPDTPASPADFTLPIPGPNKTPAGKVLSAQNQTTISDNRDDTLTAATNSQFGKMAATNDDDAGMSPANRQLAKFLRHLIGWSYLLLLLLLLLWLAYRIWRWTRRNDPRR